MSTLQLPALNVQAKAELITNNLPAFEEQFRAGLDGLKYELIADEDFLKAKDDIKALKDAEDTIKSVDQAIVNSSTDIKAIRESLAKLAAEAREFRLAREKEVKTRDAALKGEIIENALTSIAHPRRERFRQDILNGAKGKRSLEAMKKGADAVAEEINERILAVRGVLDAFSADHGSLLIPDATELELRKSAEEVERELEHRLARKKDEDEKARLRAEVEKAKAKAAPQPEPAPEPEAAPVPASAPAITVEDKEQTEFANYTASVMDALKGLGPIRKGLRHPANIAKAQAFAESVNAAWQALTK